MSLLKVNNVTDLGDDAVITAGALVGAGKILQVVQTVKTDTFSTSSTSFTDVAGLSVSITPVSTTSKVLLMASIVHGTSFLGVGNSFSQYRFTGGNAGTFVGDAASSRTRGIFGMQGGPTTAEYNFTFDPRVGTPIFLDSPATTSATTYQVQVRTNNLSVINRSADDHDSNRGLRGASSIIAMEVAG